MFYSGIESFPELIKELKIKNILLSYFYLRDKKNPFDKFYKLGIEKIFLDSGGFTARSRGVNIFVKDYGEFLKKYGNQVFCYANLDEKDSTKTLENQKYLESIGLKPLPVFHYDEFKENKNLFFDYLKKYDYIAIGGMAGSYVSFKKLKPFLDFVFSYTRDKTKVHGFGISARRILIRYPFYSVDSTSWLQSCRYGHVKIFRTGRFTNICEAKRRFIDSLGTRELALRGLKAFIEYEKFINDLWQRRGVIWKH